MTMEMKKLQGIIPPIITPFTRKQDVDTAALQGLANYMINCGVDGIFAMGTAAESPILTREQRLKALQTLKSECVGRTPLLIGVMETSTARVLELVREAEELQADAIVAVTPYYFRMKQKEIVKHFAAIREATSLPLIIYNVPVYTGNPIEPETVNEIARFPGVIAYKDSSGNMPHFQQAIRLTRDLPQFSVLQGVQVLSVISLQMGAAGLIPGVGNVIPDQMVSLYQAVRQGELEKAYTIQDFIVQLEASFSIEGYSLPVLKGMAQYLGFGEGVPHFPLQPLTDDGWHKLSQILASGHVKGGV
jgi:4-hydroxy-tetrahydrodipicolinate synthase